MPVWVFGVVCYGVGIKIIEINFILLYLRRVSESQIILIIGLRRFLVFSKPADVSKNQADVSGFE